MSALSSSQLAAIGFKRVGENVMVSDKASFHNAANIEIGSNVRIDDFCVMSAGVGGIVIGNNVHVAVFSSLIGAGRIELSDFSNISSRVSIYSSNDDYSGEFMTNPTVPKAYTGVSNADVFIGRHVIIGCGSVIVPGARLEDGVAVGALSLVNAACEPFGIYVGTPARRIRERSRALLEFERLYLASSQPSQD